MTGFLQHDGPSPQYEGVRSPVLVETPGWIRRRSFTRERRRAEATRQRLMGRLGEVGEAWRLLDLGGTATTERDAFLAVGPSGIFAITLKSHGRSEVKLVGDVVQVNGKRPPYIGEARRNAKTASTALSRAAGVSIPVLPILAFAGTGTIKVFGLPKGCIVTPHRDLPRVLNARAGRLSAETAAKVVALANHPATWPEPDPVSSPVR